MRGSRSSVDKSKRQPERGAALVKGGPAKMFGPQSAGPDAPGRTGKVQTPAPRAPRAAARRRWLPLRPHGKQSPAEPAHASY